MRCRNCNRTIPPTAKFCVYCGTATLVPVVTPGGAGSAQGLRAYVAAHKFRTLVFVFVAAAGLFALTLVLAGLGNSPPQNAVATPEPTSTPLLMTNSPQVTVNEPERSCASVSPANVLENALPSIVQVISRDGSGSGFIVNGTGLVVTNKHVVEDTKGVKVRLYDGQELGAIVDEVHDNLDLAYLEMNSSEVFTPIAIGDSDGIRVGEGVIAIGFPLGSELGFEPTITQGIISARREGLLQTDASLNPGNSGGPLLDDLGNVVGVNTSGIREADGTVITGINFAIPINEIKTDLGELLDSGQPACVPLSTAVPSPSPLSPTPVPTTTPIPTLVPTPTPTRIQAATATPQPSSTPIPTPTFTLRPTPRPTATREPRPTLPPTATATPTPTRLPLASWRDCESTQSRSYGYSVKCNQFWNDTDVASAGGHPFFNVEVKGFQRNESMDNLIRRHQEKLRVTGEGYTVFEQVSTKTETIGQRTYFHFEYRWQPSPRTCVYDVVQHIFHSSYRPNNYAFVFTAGMCEEVLDTFRVQRSNILSSFTERQ